MSAELDKQLIGIILEYSFRELDDVRAAIDRGANVNARDPYNQATPLTLAAEQGLYEVVAVLLERGADPSLRDGNGDTALAVARRNGKTKVVEVLERGSNAAAAKPASAPPARAGTAADLLAAAQKGDLAAVTSLVEGGVDIHCRHPEWGQTPLSIASWANEMGQRGQDYCGVMRLLLARRADPNVRENGGWTPLHLASYHGEADRVGILLEAGADARAKVAGGYFDGKTAIDLAASQSRAKVVEILERGVATKPAPGTREAAAKPAPEPTARVATAADLLLAAAQKGDLSTVTSLVEGGADIRCRHPESWQTPLSIASWAKEGGAQDEDYCGIMRLLLARGANPNARGSAGWAPLHLASCHGHADRVRVLLDGGADASAQAGGHHFSGQTAMGLAASQGHAKVVEVLAEVVGASMEAAPQATAHPVEPAKELAGAKKNSRVEWAILALVCVVAAVAVLWWLPKAMQPVKSAPALPKVAGTPEGNPAVDIKGNPTIAYKFVEVPAGSFQMGSPANEPNRESNERQHQVTITKAFLLGTTEVTQGQWEKVMGNNPSNFKDCGADCPVERVSWNDAVDFCNRLSDLEGLSRCYNGSEWNRSCTGYRLPTEAEWEYAARAGTTTAFHTGQCLSRDQANYDGNYPQEGCPKGQYRQKPVRVGSFSANAWGLYDMHGNVWEWTWDWYGAYPSGAVTDPAGASGGSYRVGRGGGWGDYARNCRSAYRLDFGPGDRYGSLGFRLSRSLP